MLRDGRPFLLGGVPSLADCALYNPVWFLQARMGVGDTPSPLDRLPKIVEWSKRMKAFGGGKPTEMSAADALAVAKAATPEPGKVDDSDPSGLKAGQKISVTPDDTGKVPVTGTLVGLTNDAHLDHPQRRAGGRRHRPLPARRVHGLAGGELELDRSFQHRHAAAADLGADAVGGAMGGAEQPARPAHLDALHDVVARFGRPS